MLFDYSCCDFCPYDTEYTTYNGTVCENCQAKAAERRFGSMMADVVDDEYAALFDDDEVDPF